MEVSNQYIKYIIANFVCKLLYFFSVDFLKQDSKIYLFSVLSFGIVFRSVKGINQLINEILLQANSYEGFTYLLVITYTIEQAGLFIGRLSLALQRECRMKTLEVGTNSLSLYFHVSRMQMNFFFFLKKKTVAFSFTKKYTIFNFSFNKTAQQHNQTTNDHEMCNVKH